MADISNYTSDTVVSGTKSADYIYNSGNNVTVNAGAGNDSIDNDGNKSSINAGTGNDSIETYGSYVTVLGGTGNDTIYSHGDSDNLSDNLLLDGDDGNDYIYNDSGDDLSILGDAGDDSIYSGGYDNTIAGGTDNDCITLSAVGNIVKYASGDGNDTIYGFNESDVLTITGDTYSTKTSGDDVIVTVGTGKIVLVGAKGKSLNINKEEDTNIITLTKSADTFRNYFGNVTINAGAGNDSIRNYVGNSNTIDGGDGNDTISNEGEYSVIDGGAGDERISLGSGSEKTLIEYVYGDGNDTIYGFNATSTLSIADTEYSTTKSGSNIIVTAGKDKILLVGAAYLSTVNILEDIFTKLTVTNMTSSSVTADSKIRSIDASTRTTAVKITGNAKDNVIVGGSGKNSLYGGTGDDSLIGDSSADKFYGQDGNDSLNGGTDNDIERRLR